VCAIRVRISAISFHSEGPKLDGLYRVKHISLQGLKDQREIPRGDRLRSKRV